MFASGHSFHAPGRPLGRPRHPRRAVLCALLAVAAGLLALISPALAGADTPASLTVVGTSDVSDSGLSNLMQQEFNRLYPQYTFKYKGTATGKAIASAESGADGASALIVHAPSLENHFVGNGYSYEKYGRAIFTNDFVFAGPKSDPAGVDSAGGAHNIAQAFATVARAGINGGHTPRATFVSRGDTSGTAVEERQLWALVLKSHLAPSGLLLCAVNATTDGGGDAPIAAGHGVTASGQPCPNGGAIPSGSELPNWYIATGLTQGPNVQYADACTSTNPSGPNSCYVLSDRGTYDYLASGHDPAGSIHNLKIVTRDDSASAPGGRYELINYFHAYIINPTKPNEHVNLTAARDFANLLTSPAFQRQLHSYLASGDPGGPPFRADASPIISAHGFPANAHGGRRLTISGTVTNAEPGYPPIVGKTVTIDEIEGGLPVAVAHGATHSGGRFAIRFTPTSSGAYEVSTGQIAQIERTDLTPHFGDILSPAATGTRHITVHGAISQFRARNQGGKALVLGSVAPATGHVHGRVTIYARRLGSRRFHRVATVSLSSRQGPFAALVGLSPRRWQLRARFTDPGTLAAGTSATVGVRVTRRPPGSVTLRSARARRGRVTVRAIVRPAGGRVQLLALNTSPGAPARFRVVKTVRAHHATTIRLTLRRHVKWVLQLESLHRGRRATFSRLKTLFVG